MLDWLPRTEPRRTLTIFGLVAALAVVVIVPLSLSDGDDGLRAAIEEAGETTTSTIPRPKPPPTPPPTTPPPPPSTTPAPPPRSAPGPPRKLRVGS